MWTISFLLLIHASTSRSLSGDLRVDISGIKDKFFAAGSKHAQFLDISVQGQFPLPVTSSVYAAYRRSCAVPWSNHKTQSRNYCFWIYLTLHQVLAFLSPRGSSRVSCWGVLEKMQTQDLSFDSSLLYCTALGIDTEARRAAIFDVWWQRVLAQL